MTGKEINDENNSYRNLTRYSFFLILTVLIITVLLVLHFLFVGKIHDGYGDLGEAVNGLTAPIIGIVVAVVTFLAFKMQLDANAKIKEQFEIQQFESQYFKMIDLFRKNADEMSLSKYNGRLCFAKMLEEFKFIYFEVESYLGEEELNERELTSITYCLFYFGIGNNISQIIDSYFKNLDVDFNPLLIRLKLLKEEFEYNGAVVLTNDYGDTTTYVFNYKPFKGHLSRLGHYYRHLFQTVKYITSFKEISFEQKYSYLKLLRAQLSDYELIFLFYNSLFEKGDEWHELNIFTEFRFIKNIPVELLNFGCNPLDILPKHNSRCQRVIDC